MGEPRIDASPDSICIVLPIPDSVQGVPDIPDNGEPHVTVLYVGPGSREDACRIADLLDRELDAFIDEPLALSEVGHFDRDGFTVAHSKVLVTPCTVDARRRVVEGVEGLGLEPKHHPGPWRPHATLAYQEPGTRYEGPAPVGSWVCEGAEVWRGDERFVLGARGNKLARRGGKWLVLNAAGDETLGEYETEGEARERLRQVEAAMAASDDGVEIEDLLDPPMMLNPYLSDDERARFPLLRADQRSDEDKAEIRKRWQDEGPNMGPAKLERWLESPFAGPNRKSGDARTRARRVASRALRLMKTPTADWTEADYTGALQVLAFIARMREVEPGDPLVVDGREGPSPQRAALMDWGFDPKADAASIEDRGDAEVQRLAASLGDPAAWVVHNTIGHALMDLLAREGYPAAAESIHDMTVPGEALATPLTFATWIASHLDPRQDASSPDEAQIKRWLAEHIGDVRKMPRDRMAKLKAVESEHPYLRPPAVAKVYRGLFNISPASVGKMIGPSDPVRDKSWTTDPEVAEGFARGKWTAQKQIEGRVGAVLEADASSEQLLLNHEALADLEGVADVWNEIWGEPLAVAVRDEKEVLALGPLHVRTVKVIDMSDRPRMDRAPAVITLPKTMFEVERQDACKVVGVHCYDRDGNEIKLEDLVRADAEDDVVMAPEVHPDGWVEFTVFYSRAGNVQAYGDALEYRPYDEVFAPRSLASGRGNPWELRHSKKLLSPWTVQGVARGCMRTFDRHPDGKHTFGRAKAWDIGLIHAIAGPAPEVSLAWRGLVDPRGGTTDDGERFTQVAREIIVNSLASEPKGRGGPSVRVYKDSAGSAELVTSAAQMLELAERGPRTTVYYDRRDWMMYDAGVSYRITLNRDLPIVAGEWDAGAASQRIFAAATNEAGEFDAAKAAEAFMVADPSTGKKGDLHLPVVDIRDGQKVIVKNALDAVRSRLAQEGVLDEVPADVRKGADELAGELIEEFNAKQKKQDAMPMMEVLTMLIEARGLTPAAVASELGVAGTSDLEQVFYSDDKEMQAKLVGMLAGAPASAPAQDMEMGEGEEKKKLAELMAMMGNGAKMDGAMRKKARAMFDAMMPADEGEGDAPKMVEVKIGDKSFMVPAEVKAEIESLRQRVQANSERADKAETSLAEAKSASIPRQDAEQMMLGHGVIVGETIELARRSYGADFTPEHRKDCDVPAIITPREARQDAADAVHPTLADWQRAALCGAFGDERGAKEFDAILAAPEAARGHLMKMRLDDAKSVLDERAHKSGEVKESIRRMRENNAADKADEAKRQDGADDLGSVIDKQQEVASATRTAAR